MKQFLFESMHDKHLLPSGEYYWLLGRGDGAWNTIQFAGIKNKRFLSAHPSLTGGDTVLSLDEIVMAMNAEKGKIRHKVSC